MFNYSLAAQWPIPATIIYVNKVHVQKESLNWLVIGIMPIFLPSVLFRITVKIKQQTSYPLWIRNCLNITRLTKTYQVWNISTNIPKTIVLNAYQVQNKTKPHSECFILSLEENGNILLFMALSFISSHGCLSLVLV